MCPCSKSKACVVLLEASRAVSCRVFTPGLLLALVTPSLRMALMDGHLLQVTDGPQDHASPPNAGGLSCRLLLTLLRCFACHAMTLILGEARAACSACRGNPPLVSHNACLGQSKHVWSRVFPCAHIVSSAGEAHLKKCIGCAVCILAHAALLLAWVSLNINQFRS